MTQAAHINALVRYEDSFDPGYYVATPSLDGRPLRGISIRGTALADGDQVGVIQCGTIPHDDEYGFFKVGQDLRSVLQVTSASAAQLRHSQPAGCAMNYLCQKSGRIQVRYRVGTIQQIGSSLIKVRDRLTNQDRALPLTSALSISDFVVGDEVLMGFWPGGRGQVEGWWQPATGGGIYDYSPPTPEYINWNDAGDAPVVRFGPTKSRRRWDLDTLTLYYLWPYSSSFHYATVLGAKWLMIYQGFTTLGGKTYRTFRNTLTPPIATITAERSRIYDYPVSLSTYPGEIPIAPTQAGGATVGGYYR
jgi:hypothetical protein